MRKVLYLHKVLYWQQIVPVLISGILGQGCGMPPDIKNGWLWRRRNRFVRRCLWEGARQVVSESEEKR